MLLSIKTVNNDKFTIDASEIQTVNDLKKAIYEYDNKYDICKQQIIFSGAILNNKDKLSDYKINDTSLVILMLSKNKKEAINQEKTIDQEEPIDQEKPIDQTLLNESMIQTLCSLGFNKANVIDALDTANNDINKVTKILASNKQINVNIPHQFNTQNIKELLQNPYSLPMILQSISQNNPQLVEQLQQNPQAVQQFLSDPQVVQNIIDHMNKTINSNNEHDSDYSDHSDHSGCSEDEEEICNIELSDEDNANIEVLVTLGFNKNNAIQAYLACDKDKEKAANFLFSY